MLQEAINKIEELVRASEAPRMYGEANNGEIVVRPDGEAKPVVKHDPLLLTADDLPSFARAFKNYSTGGATIWVGEERVVGVLEDVEDFGGYTLREEEGAYVLPSLAPDKVVTDVRLSRLLSSGVWPRSKNQAGFYHSIAYDFFAAKVTPDLKPLVRAMKWALNDEAEGVIRQGADAMGRSVRSEATGAGDFPEAVTVEFPAFEAPVVDPIRVQVKAQFIVDTQNRTLGLMPFPGELERAKREALNALRREVLGLVGEGFEDQVYLGGPGV